MVDQPENTSASPFPAASILTIDGRPSESVFSDKVRVQQILFVVRLFTHQYAPF